MVAGSFSDLFKKVNDFYKTYSTYIWGIFSIIVAIYLTFSPFYNVYFIEARAHEIKIDPELFNGLLTGSSILFGFSSFIVVSEKKIDKNLWIMLLISLFSMVFCGSAICDLALDKGNDVDVLLVVRASFFVNVIFTFFIAGYITSEREIL